MVDEKTYIGACQALQNKNFSLNGKFTSATSAFFCQVGGPAAPASGGYIFANTGAAGHISCPIWIDCTGSCTNLAAAGGASCWTSGAATWICPVTAGCNVCAGVFCGTTAVCGATICSTGNVCGQLICATNEFTSLLYCGTVFESDGCFIRTSGASNCAWISGNARICVCGASTAGLYCNGAKKAATIQTENGEILKLYTVESPDVVFKDYGKGCICNKCGKVIFDENFLKVTEDEIYNIQITPTSDIGNYFVSNKETSHFEISAEREGTFDWEVTKMRKNTEGTRWNTVNNPPSTIYVDESNTFEKYIEGGV